MEVKPSEGFNGLEQDELKQRTNPELVNRANVKVAELVANYNKPIDEIIDEKLDDDEMELAIAQVEAAIAKREGAMSSLIAVFQILIMDSLDFNVGEYEQERGNPPKSDSDVFRDEFTPTGELSNELKLLLDEKTSESLDAITEYFQNRHQVQKEAANSIDN